MFYYFLLFLFLFLDDPVLKGGKARAPKKQKLAERNQSESKSMIDENYENKSFLNFCDFIEKAAAFCFCHKCDFHHFKDDEKVCCKGEGYYCKFGLHELKTSEPPETWCHLSKLE